MTTDNSPTAAPERLGFVRLLIRSMFLGAIVPIFPGADQDDGFWYLKSAQIASALVLCIVLFGIEEVVLSPAGMRMAIKPIYAAGLRGGVLYAILIFVFIEGDLCFSMGAGLTAALIAMFMYWLGW